MKKNEEKIAGLLMQIKAIKLQPANPFTWASGWKSPIYCDNRKTLSYPQVRDYIRDCFVEIINSEYKNVDVIAGVATGAIAQAALVADCMKLPMVYVRPEAKKHGLGNQVEGHLEEGKNIVVIEDLVSTGKSSLIAVEALRNAGVNVLGMVAIFSYNFPKATENFENAGCKLHTLSNYNILIEKAIAENYIDKSYLDTLNKWRSNPENWMQ